MHNPNNRIQRPHNNVPSGSQPVPVAVAICGLCGARAQFMTTKLEAKRKSRPTDCGVDVFPVSIDAEEVVGKTTIFKLGTDVHVLIPPGAFGHLVERSSAINKLQGGRVIPGIIDSGYTGELFIRVAAYDFEVDDVRRHINEVIAADLAVAQLIVVTHAFVQFQFDTITLLNTPRGDKGFGSTDKL